MSYYVHSAGGGNSPARPLGRGEGVPLKPTESVFPVEAPGNINFFFSFSGPPTLLPFNINTHRKDKVGLLPPGTIKKIFVLPSAEL